jgi:hypothetical protein
MKNTKRYTKKNALIKKQRGGLEQLIKLNSGDNYILYGGLFKPEVWSYNNQTPEKKMIENNKDSILFL